MNLTYLKRLCYKLNSQLFTASFKSKTTNVSLTSFAVLATSILCCPDLVLWTFRIKWNAGGQRASCVHLAGLTTHLALACAARVVLGCPCLSDLSEHNYVTYGYLFNCVCVLVTYKLNRVWIFERFEIIVRLYLNTDKYCNFLLSTLTVLFGQHLRLTSKALTTNCKPIHRETILVSKV